MLDALYAMKANRLGHAVHQSQFEGSRGYTPTSYSILGAIWAFDVKFIYH